MESISTPAANPQPKTPLPRRPQAGDVPLYEVIVYAANELSEQLWLLGQDVEKNAPDVNRLTLLRAALRLKRWDKQLSALRRLLYPHEN
jgi:hypothetical protein